jgi:hypothetical protein
MTPLLTLIREARREFGSRLVAIELLAGVAVVAS